MNQTTLAPPPGLAETKSENPYIGVGFHPYPNSMTLFAHTLLRNSLNAGLERHAVKAVSGAGYFRKLFSVHVFEIPAAAKEQAIASVLETLSSLKLEKSAVLAALSAGEWITLGGPSDGGKSFKTLFLNPVEMDKAQKEFEELERENARSMKLLERLLKLFPKEPDSEK